MNLTKNQQTIIDKLQQEFNALNIVTSDNPYNFINFNSLNAEVNRIAQGKKELETTNNAVNKIIRNFTDDIVNKLNNDFQEGNLPLVASCNGQLGTKSNASRMLHINTEPCKYDAGKIVISIIPLTIYTEFGVLVSTDRFTYRYEDEFIKSALSDVFNVKQVKMKMFEMIEMYYKHNDF